MQIFTYTDARNNLKTVLDCVIDDSDVAVITRKEGQHAVVMGQDYYNSIMETLHLMSSPSNVAHLAKSILGFKRKILKQHKFKQPVYDRLFH